MATSLGASIEKGTEMEYPNNCSVCIENGLNAEAEKFCNYCEKLFCSRCMKKHDDLYKTHTMIDVADVDQLKKCQLRTRSNTGLDAYEQGGASGERFDIEKCDVHKSQGLMSFCEQDMLLCCNICIPSTHRECTEIVELSEVAKGIHQNVEFLTLPSQLHETLSLLDKTIHELSDEEKFVEQNADAVISKIQDSKITIVQFLDNLEEHTLEAVEKIKANITKDLQARKNECAKHYSELKSIESLALMDKCKEIPAFLANIKGKALLTRTRPLITDIDGRYRCGIQFKADFELRKMLSQMVSIGEVRSYEQTFRVTDKEEVSITETRDTSPKCGIRAMCELPSGDIVLADGANSNLKLLNKSFQHVNQCKLPSQLLDMCVVGDTEVAVVMAEKVRLVMAAKVHFYVIEDGDLRSERVINVPKHSSGIAYHAGSGNLYVATRSALLKYNWDGKMVEQMYNDIAAGNKAKISRCAISRDGQFIYVTGPDCPGLLVLDTSGHRLTFVKHDDLISPQGLHVAPGGQVFVCGTGSHTVMQLDRECSRLATVADSSDGLSTPLCMLFSKQKSCFIVAQEATDRILVFRIAYHSED